MYISHVWIGFCWVYCFLSVMEELGTREEILGNIYEETYDNSINALLSRLMYAINDYTFMIRLEIK